MAALVEVAGLRVLARKEGGGQAAIVKDVSFSIPKGEVLALIGESGSGTTTIALALLGYARRGCRIAAGSIRIGETRVLELGPEGLHRLRGRQVSYIAQSAAAAFNPMKTVMDQVVESALIHGTSTRAAAQAKAIELFAALALPDPRNIGSRYPHQVSGGQLQRAMTAMAMECRPDLIIFDEPTTALDVTTQVEVLAAIRNIVEQFQTAAIYITHDLAVVAQMADRIMVLRHGRLVEEADTRTMLTAPTQDYTKSLWAVRSLANDGRPETQPILTVKNVTASYGGLVTVLDDVSVPVPKGRTVAVVGESGSGKSTLARVITGLLPPIAGEIVFEGKALPRRLKDRDKDTLRRIQMIYQMPDTALNPRQTVRDVIGRPLEFYHGVSGRDRDRRVGELLRLIELDDRYIDRLPSELSGGQKQRICIARALAAQPDLVICDEVTSALDQIVQEEILKLLMRLQLELGITYIFITHDIATVRAIADHVVVMYKGKVVEQGPKVEVLSPPHPPYTQLLLSSVPEMDPDWLTRLLADRAKTGGMSAAGN